MTRANNDRTTEMILDSPVAVCLKHVHERSVAQNSGADVDINTTCNEFTLTEVVLDAV
jgi:hypothetical protein